MLLFENVAGKTRHTGYFLPKVELKDYNVKIDGRHSFDQPINNHIKTYESIRKITTGQEDDYTIGCLLNYPYFKEKYKIIAIYLSKQQSFDADPTAIQQINFTGNLDRPAGAFVVFILEETKKTILDF